MQDDTIPQAALQRTTPMRWLFGSLLLIGSPLLAATPVFPGGILDTTGRTAYVRSGEGIAAIDLARGDVVWHRREAQVPLLVAGERLYAVALTPANKLSILAFDLASKAESVFQTEVTEFPRWVSTLEQPGKEFRFRWTREQSTLTLTWQAQARSDAGPPKKATGRMRIDLANGRVRADAPLAGTPETLDPSAATPTAFERLTVRWHGTRGGQLMAAVLEEMPGSRAGDRKQHFVFRTWDARTGRPADSKEMLRGQRLALLVDLDEKYLWIRDAGSDGGPKSAEPLAGRPWTVFSGVDGSEVARVAWVPGATAATIVGRRAYQLAVSGRRLTADGRPAVRHTLHAFDLDTGKAVWRCELGK
jgi:hypothetical protein